MKNATNGASTMNIYMSDWSADSIRHPQESSQGIHVDAERGLQRKDKARMQISALVVMYGAVFGVLSYLVPLS